MTRLRSSNVTSFMCLYLGCKGLTAFHTCVTPVRFRLRSLRFASAEKIRQAHWCTADKHGDTEKGRANEFIELSGHVDPRRKITRKLLGYMGSRVALIKDSISSNSRLLLGGSETLCRLSRHPFSNLCDRARLVSQFHPFLFLFFLPQYIAQLPHHVSVRSPPVRYCALSWPPPKAHMEDPMTPSTAKIIRDLCG